jgi:hypothetical protein
MGFTKSLLVLRILGNRNFHRVRRAGSMLEDFAHLATAVSPLLVLFGVAVAYYQLRLSRRNLEYIAETHRQNHVWNRAYAAQEALRFYNYSTLSGPLQDRFNFRNFHDPIPLQTLLDAFEEETSLQADLHQLLNFYEGLARGINQGIFDESVVRAGRGNAMIRAERAFFAYIDYRRRNVSERAWAELSDIAARWRADQARPQRPPVGQL